MLLSSLLPIYIGALPQLSEVVSGDIRVTETNTHEMVVWADDKSIINYQNFNIALCEKVQFVQPSQTSTVLNRVVGKNPSEIFGKLESNGKLFLVNPNGIYFGKEAEVNVGSLIASTLDISNTDFLKGRFDFFLEEQAEGSQIINAGTLTAKEGGLIALLSPAIRSDGVIIAQAGNVLLASGKTVILDLEGTGLLSFAVEGELQEAMIEQAGSIEALQGCVHIAMSSVDHLVKQIINADHIVEASSLIERNGKVSLVASSKIKAQEIEILAQKGSYLNINGSLDVSSEEGVGGSVHVFGEALFLGDTEINASGILGGGEVLIGGDFQGEGPYFKADYAEASSLASISSDALVRGEGGKVVVWSEGTTIFNGQISSKGGALIGSGGLVETSGLINLIVESGKVNTYAPFGKRGTWLLDPAHIEIVAEATATTLTHVSNCQDKTSNYSSFGLNPLGGITNTMINQATSNVILCTAQEGGTIIVSAEVNTGVDVTLSVPSSGSIVLNRSIRTKSGVISLEGPVFVGSGLIALDTTNNGESAGANIVCSGSVDGGSSVASLLIKAGTGEIEFKGSIGKNIPLQAFTVSSGSELLLSSDLITNSSSTGITITPSILLMANVKIDTTKSGLFKGAPIALKGGVNGTHRLFLNAGTSEISLAASGQETPLAAIQTKAGNLVLNGDILASGGTMIFEGPVSINANLSLTDTGPTGIIFEGLVNCSGSSHTLTLSAPIGRVSLLAGIGNTLAPSSLTISSHLIQLGDDVTVTSTLTLNNAVELLGNVAISAITMTFADSVDGAYNLSLDATSSGTIAMSNIVGSIEPLKNLTIVNVDTFSAEGIFAENIIQEAGAGICTYSEFLHTTGTTGISLTSSSGFHFSGGIQTLNGGSFIINTSGAITAISNTDMALSSTFTQSGGGSVNWQGNIVTGGGDISFSGPLNLVGPVIISSGDTGFGTISFAGVVNGAHSLSLSAGLGDVTFGAAVGGTTALGDVLLMGAQNVTAASIQAQSYTQILGYGSATYAGNITTTGSLGINITSNYVAFAGQTGGKTLTTTNGNLVINAILGGINSLANPVQISVNGGLGTLFVGSASPGYFSGTVKTLCAVRSNVPCFIDYNGTEYTPTTCCVSP